MCVHVFKVGKPSKSKHNILSSGSLQFLSLSKEDHGEWECVATNVVTSITASTRLLVIGTVPCDLITLCPHACLMILVIGTVPPVFSQLFRVQSFS